MISRAGRPRINRVGIASAFSPTLLPLFADAAKFTARCNATLSVLHVGPGSEETDQKFLHAVQQLQVASPVTVVYKDQANVVEGLKAMAKKEAVDLLVAGAVANQNPSDALPADIARTLLRHAPCPLLLLTDPLITGTRFKRIVAATDFSPEAEQALQAAYWLAVQDKAESLCVFSTFKSANDVHGKGQTQRLFESGTIAEETERLEAFVSPLLNGPVPINFRVVPIGKGLAAKDYLQTTGADLLVMPARRDNHGGILLPPYMDWIFQVVPGNIWIIPPHTRNWRSDA